MKILLVGNFLPDAQESMARLAAWLQESLTGEGHQVRLVRPKPRIYRLLGRKGGSLKKWLAYIDKFIIFPVELRRIKRRFDVVHICDHGNSLYVRHLADVPNVVTCHDLLAVQSALGVISGQRTGFTGRVFQHLITEGIAHARQVVCVSGKTERDLQSILGERMPPSVVINNPLNWPYSRMSEAAAQSQLADPCPEVRKPFFLHVGGNQWYKNRAGAIALFSMLKRRSQQFSDYQLVMVGKPLDAALRSSIPDDLRKDVLELVGADNETLRSLYSLTEALLFPSLAEGFGWPIIEAQACGALVITTDREPMSEVAGGGAILIEPEDLEQSVWRILERWGGKDDIRAKGLENLHRFSPESALASYVRIYRAASDAR